MGKDTAEGRRREAFEPKDNGLKRWGVLALPPSLKPSRVKLSRRALVCCEGAVGARRRGGIAGGPQKIVGVKSELFLADSEELTEEQCEKLKEN